MFMEIRGTEKMKNITKEEMNIKEFFEKYPNVAIALSGGVDSVFLVYMAKKYAKSVKAYFVKSVFQPEFEKKDAEKICRQLGVDLKILNVDVLSNKLVTDNPVNRCYYCKQGVFGTILEAAKNDGMTVILDGTNASDDEKIKQVETAETFLFDLGFSDFRVRWMDNKAKIQMPESQLQALMEKREIVLEELSKIFDEVLLDLRTR